MSATVLIVILIGGGAIAFYMRFLIALHKESRGRRICEVKKINPQVYEFTTRKPDRRRNPVWTKKWSRVNVWRA